MGMRMEICMTEQVLKASVLCKVSLLHQDPISMPSRRASISALAKYLASSTHSLARRESELVSAYPFLPFAMSRRLGTQNCNDSALQVSLPERESHTQKWSWPRRCS